MNRAERRRLGAQKDPTVVVLESEIKRREDVARDEGITVGFELMLAMPIMVLRDKHGFTKEQSEEFVEEVLEVYRAMNADYVTLEDLRATLWEEAGIEIKVNKGER